MKYVALILCAAVAIVALSAGSTFAVLEWAPERLPQGAPGERGAAGKAGPTGARGPRGPAATVDPAADTTYGSDASRIDELETATADAQRLADKQLDRECKRANEDSAWGVNGPQGELEEQARTRYRDLGCSQR